MRDLSDDNLWYRLCAPATNCAPAGERDEGSNLTSARNFCLRSRNGMCIGLSNYNDNSSWAASTAPDGTAFVSFETNSGDKCAARGVPFRTKVQLGCDPQAKNPRFKASLDVSNCTALATIMTSLVCPPANQSEPTAHLHELIAALVSGGVVVALAAAALALCLKWRANRRRSLHHSATTPVLLHAPFDARTLTVDATAPAGALPLTYAAPTFVPSSNAHSSYYVPLLAS